MALHTARLRTIEQVRAFVVGTEPVNWRLQDRESAYAFVRRTLVTFGYHRLGKGDRGWVRRYMAKVTGFLRVDTVHQGDRDGVKGVYIGEFTKSRARSGGISCHAGKIRRDDRTPLAGNARPQDQMRTEFHPHRRSQLLQYPCRRALKVTILLAGV